jgi:hypothetical protein
MKVFALSVAAFVALLLPGLPQAHAAFRGEERFPRDFEYNSEYFWQAESFALPFWWEDAWLGGESGYRMSLGSVKTDEFILFQEAKVSYPVLDWLRAGYHYLGGEDFDSRFHIHRISMTGRSCPYFAGGLHTELDADKEWIDLGGHACFSLPGTWDSRIEFTLVDAVFNQKGSAVGTYERAPYALVFDNVLRVHRGLRARARVSADLPLRLADDTSGFVFGFHRSRWRLEATWEPAAYWTVRVETAGEIAGKRWEYGPYTAPMDPPDPREERMQREALSAKVEVLLRLRLSAGHMVNAGLGWFQLREFRRFPNNPAGDYSLKKRDFVLWLRVRVDLGAGFFLLPAVYVGPVWHRHHFFHNPSGDRERFVPLNSKLNVSAGYRFSERSSIVGIASFALDRAEFDGGGACFVLSF